MKKTKENNLDRTGLSHRKFRQDMIIIGNAGLPLNGKYWICHNLINKSQKAKVSLSKESWWCEAYHGIDKHGKLLMHTKIIESIKQTQYEITVSR